jgi:hypothetical protein
MTAVGNTPNPSVVAPAALTVIQTVAYPSWWASATTVALVTGSGTNTQPVGVFELFPYGVSITATEEEGLGGTIVPWAEVLDLHLAS